MDKKIIFSIFVGLAVMITAMAIQISSFFETEPISAGGFGISPPYLRAEHLLPRDTYSQRIRVLRGDTDKDQKVIIKIYPDEIDDWINLEPSNEIYFAQGKSYLSVNFIINVPADAVNGNHSGKVYFALANSDKKSGVSVRLGARADINIQVEGGREKEEASENKKFGDVLSAVGRDFSLSSSLAGYFILRPESKGQLYYLDYQGERLYYLSDADDLANLFSQEGRGISNELLQKIPIDTEYFYGADSDSDGLPDAWEVSIGSNPDKKDTDNDGWDDLAELEQGFSLVEKNKMITYDADLAENLAGFILLQVENRGEAWYLEPDTKKRILFSDRQESFAIIKNLARGISEENYHKLIGQ